MKVADGLLGALACACLRPARPAALPRPESVRAALVIRPGGLGDAVLLLPLLSRLRVRFPAAEIDVLAERRNAAIFAAAPEPARCLTYDAVRPAAMLRALRARRYDMIIDSEQWHFGSAVVGALTGAAVRVGFDSNPRRVRCYTHVAPYAVDAYEGINFARLLGAATGQSVEIDWTAPWLTPPAADRQWAADALGDRRPVAIALRGGIPERCWPADRWRAVAARCCAEGLTVCLLGAAADREAGAAVAAGLPADQVRNLAGELTLMRVAALLQRSVGFLGTDSGLMHVAASVGSPVVALFGSGIEPKWAPQGPRHRIINRRLACSPCTRVNGTPRCPIRYRCLDDISVEDVLAAWRDLPKAGHDA